MKAIYTILLSVAIVLLCLTTYNLGYKNAQNRDFEAACLMMDFIRLMMDNEEIGAEVEESFYECYDDMEYYNTKYIKSIDDLNNKRYYYWY